MKFFPNDSGFRKVRCCAPEVILADPLANAEIIAQDAKSHTDCHIIVYPELSITGYTCADLFHQTTLLDKTEEALLYLAEVSFSLPSAIVVGAPLRIGTHLLNCAIFIHGGEILGALPKTFIPNYNEFYEKRWFQSGNILKSGIRKRIGTKEFPVGIDLLFEIFSIITAAEICEDLWTPIPPSSYAAMAGADLIVNLSASNDTIGKRRYRRSLVAQQSARCRAAYAYASAGIGESSTDLAYPGHCIIAEDGTILAESAPELSKFNSKTMEAVADIDIQKLRSDRLRFNTFSEGLPSNTDYTIIRSKAWHSDAKRIGDYEGLIRKFEQTPFVPSDKDHRDENCAEIVDIQCHGLAQRLRSIGCKTLVIGISGGLDSTLALLLACRTFDMLGYSRSGIQAITMPGLATTKKTRNNAWDLMQLLGCTCHEIPIGKAVEQHFSDIGQNPEKFDATYENSQARERTQILMDFANKTGGIVLGTGDLSELALGWCTFNGDHMSMYAINSSVPKTLVKHLVEWFAERTSNPQEAHILRDIIDTPISPELVPSKSSAEEIAQKTEDLVGPYVLHDFFLYHMLRNSFAPEKIFRLACIAFKEEFTESTILKWLENYYRRFFSQQFKRSCLPDGPKVGSVCLSPRGDWRMPSDAKSTMWLQEIEELKKSISPGQ